MDSFIVLLKSEVVYNDLAEDVETRFNISNYEVNGSKKLQKYKILLIQIISIFNKKNNYGFNQHSTPIVFLKNIYNRKLSLREADQEQHEFTNELKNSKKGRIPYKKGLC